MNMVPISGERGYVKYAIFVVWKLIEPGFGYFVTIYNTQIASVLLKLEGWEISSYLPSFSCLSRPCPSRPSSTNIFILGLLTMDRSWGKGVTGGSVFTIKSVFIRPLTTWFRIRCNTICLIPIQKQPEAFKKKLSTCNPKKNHPGRRRANGGPILARDDFLFVL